MKKIKIFKVVAIIAASAFLAVNLFLGSGTIKKNGSDISLSSMTKISNAQAVE